MAVPSQFIDDVMARTDIVSLVGEYVDLKQKGRDYSGLCPFHLEKNPSFYVVPERGFYKCFGCGNGGGPVKFLMEIESLSFLEALEKLANRVNMEMPVASWEDRQERDRREKILNMNSIVARFYVQMLNAPHAEQAKKYLEQRGLTRETCLHFGIGFAPDSWDSVLQALTAAGYSVDDLLDAGLVKRNEKGKVYDRFRNRIMFPIINIGGKVIGFGGRLMEQGEPKYLNSPDTPVFDKSRNLYGLNFAKKSKNRYGILTEGYMDTIALHQGGFDSAVASLGTSFTEGHGQLLARYFEDSVLAYDSDTAGVKAAERAIPILKKAGMSVRVLQMRDAKDPDEFIKKFGRGAFSNLLAQSVHHLEFRLKDLEKKYNIEDMTQKVKFLEEVAVFLATIDNLMEQEIYADKAAEVLGVSSDSVLFEVKKKVEERRIKEENKKNRNDSQTQGKGETHWQAPEYTNIEVEKAEEGLLRVLNLEKSYLEKMTDYTSQDFLNPILGKWFQQMKDLYFQGSSVELRSLEGYFQRNEMNYMTGVLQAVQDLGTLDIAFHDYLGLMRRESELSLFSGDDELLAMQQQLDEEERNAQN